ncbi:hypothetical protein [uncultured Draconibacterium sp.]|uniref:hypothetical protein n=1 Tax=uncultured Draconibacterium sp. TaxID=1573823 RepID=UPI00325FFE5E
MKQFILLILMAQITIAAKAQVTTRPINYKGWENAIELTNKQIRVVVVPQIGRIMHFSYLGKENLLYENTAMQGRVFSAEHPYKVDGELAHANFGGDRIWPTAQDAFVTLNGNRSLSDPWIDGSPWEYELLKNGVQITSRVSDYIGTKVTRTITLEETEATVNIKQSMIKMKAGNQKSLEPIPVTIWNLSKIKNPLAGLLPLSKNSIFKNSIEFQRWPDNINSASENYSQHDNVGQLIPASGLFQKMGTDSKGWVAGLFNDLVFGQFFSFNPRESYPDGGTSATIFTCTDFTELECLSPEKKLKVGESIEFDLQWKLHKINAETFSDKRAEAVKWLEQHWKQ